MCFFALVQIHDCAGGKFNRAVVACVYLCVLWNDFTEPAVAGRGFFFDKHREHTRNHGGDKFRVCISPKLFQRFNDQGKKRHAAALSDALPVHNVKHISPPGLCAPRFNARPPGFRHVIRKRVVLADMVGHDFARVVGFNAADDMRVNNPVRIAQPVRFDQTNSQVVRHICPLCHGQCCDNVTAHKPVQKRELLQFVEVVKPFKVAGGRIGPQ